MAHNAQRVMVGLVIAMQAIFGSLPASAQLSVPPLKSDSAGLESPAPLVASVAPLADSPPPAPTIVAQEIEPVVPTPALTVSVLTPRGRIASGEDVTLTLLVEAPALVRDITISLTLPEGPEAVGQRSPSGPVVFANLDIARRRTIQVLVRAASGGPASLRLRVEASAPSLAPAAIRAVSGKLAIYGDRVVQRVSAAGGRAAFGERIAMSFAANALSRDADVEISAGPTNADPEDEFDPILAFEASPGQAFRAPVTLTLALSGLLGGRAGYGSEPVLRYWKVSEDGRSRAAERIPASFDPGTSELVATLEHFSQYDVVLQTPQDPKPWRMVPDPSTALRAGLGGVNAFRGTSAIAIPIDMPPMQDGLEPKLALQYSSGGAERQSDSPGGAGMGWSLDTPVVRQRVSIYEWDWGETCGNNWCNHFGTALSDANDYSLSLGGQEYSLVHIGGGEFVTERYAPLRIWYCASQTTCLAPQAPGARALSSDAFWVWTEDGTLYVFGGDGETTSRIWANRANADDSDVIGWHLRYVYATHRDDPSQANRWSVKYNYWAMSSSGIDYRLLTRVEYGNSLGTTARHTVTIGYVDRWPLPMPMKYQPLAITVTAGQTGDTIWRYELDYGYFPDRYVLTAVTKVAVDGARMPATTFEYTSVCIDGASPCKTATLMTRVSNGYGGSVEYAFEPGPTANAAERRVATETTNDGASNVAVRTFQYSQPCKNENNTVCRTYHDFGPSGYLMGYGVVTETARDSANTALRIIGHHYYTDALRLGMEGSSVTMDAAGTALTAQTTEWDALGCDAGWPDGSWLVTALTSTSFLAGDASSSLFRRTATKTGLTRTNCARISQVSEGIYAFDKASWTDRKPTALLWQGAPTSLLNRWGILRDPAPGAAPLYLCGFSWTKPAGDKSEHTFLSRQANCSWPGGWYSGQDASAFRYGVGLAGYIYTATNGIYSQPLILCLRGNDNYNSYHDLVAGTSCPAYSGASSNFIETLGYVSPDTPAAVSAAGVALKAQAVETAESDASGVARRSASASAVLSTTPASAGAGSPRWAVVGISQTVRDGAGNLLDETRAFYDDLATFGAVAKGDLTFVQKRANGSASIDRKLSYDANGALESETVYADYGTLGVMTNTSGVLRRTSNVFDSGTGMYVTQQRVFGADTAPQTRTVSYTYFGVNGESVTNTLGARQPVGALKVMTDANQAVTAYAYDTFGRLRKVARPGDSLADPSEEWRYYDGIETSRTMTASGFTAGPFVTDHRVRGLAGGGWTSSTLATLDRTIYDGLGRVIQTQTRAGQGWQLADCADSPRKTLGAEVIQSTLYDALGRAAIQTVPYTQTQYEYCTTAGRVNTPYVAVPQTQTMPNGPGLAAAYYNGINFNTLTLQRTDATVNFDWGNSNVFSARWTGTVRATTTENYTFYATGDDGIRLWVNGQLIIDKWQVQGPTEYAAQVALQAGVPVNIVFEYYNNGGGAVARLMWSSPSVAKQVIPSTSLSSPLPPSMGFPIITPTVPYEKTDSDALGRPMTVTAPDGTRSVARYGVDANGPGYTGTNLALKTSIDPNGHQKQQVSDGLGRLIRVREFTGTSGSLTLYGETRYAYDAADRLTSVTDALGNVTTIRYDGLGRKVEMFDPDMGAWRYGYNALGQLTSQTDAKGKTMVFSYDALGRMTGKGAWMTETVVYEAESAPYAHMSGCGSAVTNGGTTAWVGACESYFTVGPYAAPQRAGPGQSAVFRLAITSTQVANDSTIVAKIDVFDWTTGQTLALRELARSAFGGGIGNYREFDLSFDSTGRETHQLEYRVWGYSGNETIAHDRTTLLWAGPQASYLYDQGNNGIGRRARMTDATGYSAWAYDARGRVITATKQINPNPAAYATLFGYDAANRLITTTYPGGEVVTNTFDAAGQPYGLNAGGSPIVKSATYNALGQPRSIDFGNGLSQRRYYGGLDTTLYNVSYGKMRQLCVAQTSLGECADDAAPGRGGTGTMLFNAVYGYDASGNVTAVDDRTPGPSQINEYVYDSLDRLTEWRKVTSWSPYSATIQEAYAYSPIGNMTSKAGVTITNGTAKSGVLTTLGFEAYSVYSPSNPGGSFVTPQTFGSWSFEGSAGVSYNNTHLTSGNPAAPEGMQVAFIQGDARMTATVSGFVIGQTYRIGFMMAQRVNYGLPQTVTVRVGNVALGTFTAPTGDYGPKWSEPFTATATSQTFAVWGAPDNGEDRMAFIDRVVVATAGPHAAVAMGNGNTYTYNPNGNMTVRREMSGTQPFTYTQSWTVDNRLAVVVKSDVTGTILATTTYWYDADGVRVRKTDPSGTTLYLGTVEVLITGSLQVTTSYYAFGGAMVAMRTTATATLTYLHGDHLGSVSLTTNASGQKVSEQRYAPYGEVRWSSGAGMPTDFTFTSQRAGPPAYVGSLTDYVARFYSPALGRFISADTIVPGAGNPAAFNRYMYVRGNPLRYVDPSGHMDASPDDNGATPGINDWPCGIENDCQMDWNNNAASRFGTGVLDEIGDALKGFFGLASAAANPASVIAAGFRAGSDFGANVASNGWESAISGALDDNPFIGAMRSGDYAYAGGRFIGFVSMAGLAGEFAPKGVCSFSPDTPVATEAGLIPIAGVITGTRVLAWDETANATGYYPVTNVWVHWDLVLVVLIIDGETITTTPEHPFYTPMHGWLPAGELWVGAGLRRADGGTGIVESATTVTRTELMWNLTVDVVHTFFVGGGEWLAHNTCGVTSRIRDLQAAGVKDAHHVVQDAAVRDLPGYESLKAPGVSLSGPSTQAGTPHYLATMVQRQAGGGSLGAELRIGYKALRVAGYAEETARRAISEASDWFRSIGATSTTVTRIPGNR